MNTLSALRLVLIVLLGVGAIEFASADNHEELPDIRILHVYKVTFPPLTRGGSNDGDGDTAGQFDAIMEWRIPGHIMPLIGEIVETNKVNVVPREEEKPRFLADDDCKSGSFTWAITGTAIPMHVGKKHFVVLEINLNAVSESSGSVICTFKDGGSGNVEFDDDTMEFTEVQTKGILQDALESLKDDS